MFNVIISGNGTAWETDQLMRMDASRFGEYSEVGWGLESVKEPKSRKLLEAAPTLLMYENGCKGPATQIVRFGFAREVQLVNRQILFHFDEQGHFSRTIVDDFEHRLGIQAFEQNRTHWAVKEGGIPSGVLDLITPIPFGSKILERTRVDIVDALLRSPNSFHGELDSLDFLKRIWDLSAMPSRNQRSENAEADIWQHTVNNFDWDDGELLKEYLALPRASDAIFLKFVETSVLPGVGSREEIAARVREINKLLKSDGFHLVESFQVSLRPVFKAGRIGEPGMPENHAYEIVLSFAGEDRKYVAEVAEFLVEEGVEVFYDRNEEASLWGKDLAEHLDLVYRKSARFCVMFISKTYADRIWPNHERRSALARAVEDRVEYILPARFDNTELPGIRPTVGYVDLTQKTPQALGKLILKKLGRPIPNDE